MMVYAVNKEEEGQQVQENVLFLFGILQGVPQLQEGILHRLFRGFLEGRLGVVLQQRDRAANPPEGDDAEGNGHSGALG